MGESIEKSNGGANPNKKSKLDPEFLPANRHAPTPLEKQRAEVARLLQNPTREIHLPKAPKDKTIRPPREMMKNVQGSSAGAGSGEFHVYKQSRRREYERLRLMDEREENEKIKAEFEKKQAELKRLADSKTEKNRLKRQKKKETLRKKKQSQAAQNGQIGPTARREGGAQDQSGDSDSDGSSDGSSGDNQNKKRMKLGAAPSAAGMVFKQPNSRSTDDEDDDDRYPPQESPKETSHTHDLITSKQSPNAGAPVPVVQSVGLTIVEDEW